MIMSLTEGELNAFLRDDFEEFIARSFSELNPGEHYMPNWHIRVIAQALEEVRSGKIKRLIINVPPRSLKSIATSVAFSAWLLGHDPSKKIICASYSQDRADKHAEDTRTVMGSDFCQRLFPSTRLTPSRRSVSQLTTTGRGSRLATSVGGSITGHGADIVIIDDPIKSGDAFSPDQLQKVNDWYTDSVPSRLNNIGDGAIIIVMQRFHEHDLVEYVQRKEQWKVLSLPAIAAEDESYAIRSPYGTERQTRNIGQALHPERASREALHALYYRVGKANFYAQYQQAPIRLKDLGLIPFAAALEEMCVIAMCCTVK
jgi:hypothetical protein